MKKIFHISDLLSAYLGMNVSIPEAMQMPDGTMRPAYMAPIVGTMRIIEHLTGESCDTGTSGPHEVNMYDIFRLLPAAKHALEGQHPWLKGVSIDKSAMPDTPDECLAFLREWVKAVAKKHGGEWFEVESTAPQAGLHTTSDIAVSGRSPRGRGGPLKRTLH